MNHPEPCGATSAHDAYQDSLIDLDALEIEIRNELEPEDFYAAAIERILEWPEETLKELIASQLASEVLRGVCRNTGLTEFLDEDSSQQMIDHSHLTKAFRSILDGAMRDCMEDEICRRLDEVSI